MISQKLKEIEKDTISRLDRIKSYRCDGTNYFFSRNKVLSLTPNDAILLFGLSNTNLETIEKMISILVDGLSNDGALIFSMKNGYSVFTVVNDNQDDIQRLNKENVRSIINLFIVASEYLSHKNNDISDVLSEDFGKNNHPYSIYLSMVNEAKLNAVKFGWEPNEKQLTCAFGEL
jgi:hypothetical protein